MLGYLSADIICSANPTVLLLKNRFISNYFKLAAFSSPVKFSKSVFFFRVKFPAKSEVVLQKTIYVDRCESLEIRLFYRKSLSRWRWNSPSMLQRNSRKYSNDQRVIFTPNCTEGHTRLWAITVPSYKDPNKLSQLQKTWIYLWWLSSQSKGELLVFIVAPYQNKNQNSLIDKV